MSLDTPEMLEIPDCTENELHELFHQRGWGDGLPIIAPTRNRVEEMLSISEGLDPDEIKLKLDQIMDWNDNETNKNNTNN